MYNTFMEYNNFDTKKYEKEFLNIFKEIYKLIEIKELKKYSNKYILRKIPQLLRNNPKNGNDLFSRDELILGFNYLKKKKLIADNDSIIELIKLKPTRTISGVTPITVLTKPFACPGKCIFCPNDIRMPKSYIASEPGAQRAGRNAFDPYLQTYNRLLALKSIGHNTDKIELIILGGTWSFYPEGYQRWFIKRCFDAMNDFGIRDGRDEKYVDFDFSTIKNDEYVDYNKNVKVIGKEECSWEDLEKAQVLNEKSLCRNVGLVLETRPDYINHKEIINLRRLGATKIQMGVQSLNDDILKANKRGTTREQIKNAFELIRLYGFKCHVHMMPNLYKATIESDLKDYKELWGEEFCPDELKIYPTSIIKGTELYQYYKEGKYKPYEKRELIDLLKQYMILTPRYCRITRMIRDIPSNEIHAGNKTTNLRQLVEDELIKENTPCKCIRCREIKDRQILKNDLKLSKLKYTTTVGTDYFLSVDLKSKDKICGFLRLFIPKGNKTQLEELKDASIIREVHVYGKVANIGESNKEFTQHLGIGKRLIKEAIQISKELGFKKIAVISAIGTREYYLKQGFKLKNLYMVKEI